MAQHRLADIISPDKAYIFRIVHRDNLLWILQHGIHCRSSGMSDSNYVSIGNADIIAKRSRRSVEIAPYGTLSDYVPFYFTPRTPMLSNILAGRNGVKKRDANELVVIVSSLGKMRQLHVAHLFTNCHAYVQLAKYYDDLSALRILDWDLLRRSDFERDPDDPGKLERYQAEALVYKHVPAEAIAGLGCNVEFTAGIVKATVAAAGASIPVVVRPEWFFQ